MTAPAGEQSVVRVSVFGLLRDYMVAQGLPWQLEMEIKPEGSPASQIAGELGIPPEKIEAVFCNGRVINFYDPVSPGDRLAFFPYGTPGPYRVFLGMFKENIEREKREKS